MPWSTSARAAASETRSGTGKVTASGTTACLGMTLALYIDLLAKRLHARRPAGVVVAGLNRAAAAIDRRVPDLREPRPGALIANYHVAADA